MKRFLSPVQSGYFFIFLFFAALLTLIDGSFASLSIYQLSICLSTSSRKIIMFAASKHMDIYLSIALPMVSCTMSPLDLNNNFIKTTYDISLDSQISFLPLGFSPTIYLLLYQYSLNDRVIGFYSFTLIICLFVSLLILSPLVPWKRRDKIIEAEAKRTGTLSLFFEFLFDG